jgi:hypothetical protein
MHDFTRNFITSNEDDTTGGDEEETPSLGICLIIADTIGQVSCLKNSSVSVPTL